MPRKTLTAGLKRELELVALGKRQIVGIDEAGRGAWAGAVYAGAVILPLENPELALMLAGVRDSKQMTPSSRARLISTIKMHAVAWGVGFASCTEIDTLGIVPATCLAMHRALEQASQTASPDYLMIDSIKCVDPYTWELPYESIVGGDRLSLSIAAASVLAKVSRDEHMREMHLVYPAYGFSQHKGYGTASHRAAIQEHGACAIHRMTFAPMRGMTP